MEKMIKEFHVLGTKLGMYCFRITFLKFKFYYSKEGGKQVTPSTNIFSLQSSLFELRSTETYRISANSFRP